MDSRSRAAFGLLILAQAAHSLEEYVYRLFDVFGPARFVSSLISDNLALGFALANTALVLFGLWCYLARVRPSYPSARGYAWFWTCLEIVNGVGHVLLSLRRGGYFPGVGTAPLLIAASSYLSVRLTRLGRVS
jgi:Protein of unknown function with HXXEE motif